MKDVIVVGGGLSGLVSSILLARAGLRVTLYEKNSYPFHRVCGEYISNEVIPFLENHDLFPSHLAPSSIDQLTISSASGRSFSHPLDLGGFGISRYAYDAWLAGEARKSGVQLHENCKVRGVRFLQDERLFEVESAHHGTHHASLVILAHGKRSILDQHLQRPFLANRSPYVGIKYHVKTDFPANTIALHNFTGGYCGISKIEGERYNICYLAERKLLRKYGDIPEMEKNVLYQNPMLRELFENSEFLLDNPQVINEISFSIKSPVEGNFLFAGDASGMITPLCGNGMAMGIHAAKLLTETILNHRSENKLLLEDILRSYEQQWKAHFGLRLKIGRTIQNGLFGKPFPSELAVVLGKTIKPLTRALIRQTHGEPFS
ncbi:NAD(P)/FAD-dependent oxidoreductase [Marinoscillum furvescens]|uniref:Flavin-dependent dehydrogenase n=1 Tax=Marinoscillum furvescens DSM 4134 TaxID=1122208 RepID=A0A3D9L442_MARFU|nr:NAD(P)/FAD-dependent oxidoreductase [Marinoscillum furvescens]REE00395.1 flavin-dependent dehydrogenase [Marinoscillum furvescens DSM 4134]